MYFGNLHLKIECRMHAVLMMMLIHFALPETLFSQFDKLKNFNVKDGLPSTDVYNIMQDKKGFIWTTGDMGVSRFDGYKFRNFSTQEGMPDNTIFGLYEDEKERIWFRSYSGKLSYFKNDSIFTLPCNDTLRTFFRSAINNSIYIEKDTIWLGSTIGYIIKISPGWQNRNVSKIVVPGDNKYIYILSGTSILYGDHIKKESAVTDVFDRNFRKLYTVDANEKLDKMPRFFVKRLANNNFIMSMNNLLIHFNERGIIHQKKENFSFIALETDIDGSIFASTTTGFRTYQLTDFSTVRKIQQLEGKVITGAFTDKENSVWITTEGHGLYCITHRHFKYYTPENGLTESKITALGTYTNGVIAGHLDATVSKFMKDSIATLRLDELINRFPLTRRINTIFQFRKKTMITTGSNSYFIINDRLKPVFDETISIKSLCASSDSNLWIIRYSSVHKIIWPEMKESHKFILPARADNLFEDSKGTLWIGAMEGVYTLKEKQFEKHDSTNLLFKNRIVDVREKKDGSLWFGTRGAGIIVKTKSGNTQISEKEGLAGNMCRSIFIDGDVVWVGTNKGLSKIVTENGKFKVESFYSTNGLLTDEVNMVIKHENKLWLAHNNGISVVDPAELKNNRYSAPVYILEVKVNDSIFHHRSLPRLHYDQNYFSVNYAGLSYKNAGNIEYKYRMEGLDSAWTYTRYTSVNYQALPAGSYRFIVYAKNNDGFWGKEPATFSFTICPAWWQTWWFRILSAAGIAAMITFMFKYRLKRLRAREKEKSKLKQRVAETELHALRAQMNPHFVFNAINSVQYFITRNDSESSQKYLAKFARLIRYVVDNSKLALIPLKIELDALNLYLELESLRFEKKFTYVINIDKKIDPNSIHIPSMLIQPYIENAIWHGLMHKKDQGQILISLELLDSVLKCTVEDNGIGRKKSAELKQKIPGHASLGMIITKERLDIINQVNNSNLSLVITDLYDESGEAKGTKVEINIPLN